MPATDTPIMVKPLLDAGRTLATLADPDRDSQHASAQAAQQSRWAEYEYDRPGRLTDDELADLRLCVTHATLDSILASAKDGCNPEVIEDISAYLRDFADPQRDGDGKVKKGHPCLRCGQSLAGDLADQLLSRGGFRWGLAHGHGQCGWCGWPATLYHFIKDRSGEDLMTIRHIVLQVHPDLIEIRKPSEAESA